MDRSGSLWPETELNSVPWATLRQAYGAAADVPGMITALRDATDAESAGHAEHALWCAVLHQGNVCSATAPALPFVIRLLAGRPDLRPLLADWLGDLSTVFDEADESGPASDCRDVLIAAAPQLAALLDDTHAEVRSITAGYLARCLPAASYCWEQIHARWADEHDDGVRADYLISLAQLAQAADRRTETLQLATAWRTPDNAAYACAAAHAQLLIDPRDEPAQAVLLAALPQGHPLGTWWGSGSQPYIIETLARSPGGLTRLGTLPEVLQTIAVSHHFAASMMLRLLLCEVFPDGRASVPQKAVDLTTLQREVLSFLASGRVQFKEPKGRYMLVLNTGEPLIQLGLPADITPLRRWLADDRRGRRGNSPFRRG
jgi:hypothetical protein